VRVQLVPVLPTRSNGARSEPGVRPAPAVLQFHTHPVMLWVVGEYLGEPLIRPAQLTNRRPTQLTYKGAPPN
jgi:hypothetical protein